MQSHVVCAHVKQLRHLQLRQPDGLILGAQRDLAALVVNSLEDQVVHGRGSCGEGNNCCVRPCLWVLRALVLHGALPNSPALQRCHLLQSLFSGFPIAEVGAHQGFPEPAVVGHAEVETHERG
jgi:hypothetical protein